MFMKHTASSRSTSTKDCTRWKNGMSADHASKIKSNKSPAVGCILLPAMSTSSTKLATMCIHSSLSSRESRESRTIRSNDGTTRGNVSSTADFKCAKITTTT